MLLTTAQAVLIYPYWNVNLVAVATAVDNISGFNLSILECKYVRDYPAGAGDRVLIYPYWNVNL